MKPVRLFLLLLLPLHVHAQDISVKYRRSSLCTFMITDLQRTNEDIITEAFLAYPLSEKFNEHNVGERILHLPVVKDDQKQSIGHYLDSSGIARLLIAKWFGRDTKGNFNTQLVASRGMYNATEMDAGIVRKTQRGMATLADAGEELIGNTFVLVSNFRYMSKEALTKELREQTDRAQKAKHIFKIKGLKVLDRIEDGNDLMELTGPGYAVVIQSSLYRLNWNDNVASSFYENLWTDANHFRKERVLAFNATDLFTLQYVGSDMAWTLVQSVLKGKTEQQMIHIATVQAMDAVIAKLQNEHEDFRIKTPLLSIDPLMAKTGLKEGIRPGDKFEVLEQILDAQGRTRYQPVATIKAGKHIWNNCYMATGDSTHQLSGTLFEHTHGGKIYPGMLIRQKSKRILPKFTF